MTDDGHIARLKRAMADAHPDRGGTPEAFAAARAHYKQELATAQGDSRAAAIAGYDLMEARLREIIAAPHWKIRRGEVVLDADGQPVPDPVPARKAQRLLGQVTRDRKRLTG